MRKPLFAASILLATIAAAQATQPRAWYILSGQDNECHPAKQVMSLAPTPEAFHRFARANGLEDDVKVYKDQDGNVDGVQTSLQGRDGVITWFPSQQLCETALQLIRQTGVMPSMDDLK